MNEVRYDERTGEATHIYPEGKRRVFQMELDNIGRSLPFQSAMAENYEANKAQRQQANIEGLHRELEYQRAQGIAPMHEIGNGHSLAIPTKA